MHHLIKDTEFQEIFKVLSQIKGIHKRNIERLRNFIEAVCYALRTGCQWRLLPTEYGSWRAVHKRFKQWSDKNIWEYLFENVKKDPDMENAMIDATVARAHACAAGYGKDSQEKEALGRSRGGFSTKIHALCDALGLPLKFILTPGQDHDITQAAVLTGDIFDAHLLADTGYDSDDFRNYLKNKNCVPVIPPRRNRVRQHEYDEFLYEDRSKIECFFGKIKHFRRVFVRYEKAAKTFLSFLHFTGALIWLR